MTQTPTIGRIVIAKGLDPASNNGATEAPAIITRVWSESGPGKWTVNARIIADGPPVADRWLTSVYLFDEEGATRVAQYLIWPPRVGA